MSDANNGPPPPGPWEPDPADVSPFEPPVRRYPPPPPDQRLPGPAGHGPAGLGLGTPPPVYGRPQDTPPPPRYGSSPPPPMVGTGPPRKRGRWKWFAGLGLVLLLGIGGCVWFLVALTAEPREAAQDFLAALRDDRIADAQDLIHPECGIDASGVGDIFPSPPSSFSVRSSSITKTSGAPAFALIGGNLSLVGESDTRPFTMELRELDDRWLVCGVVFGSPG